MSLHLTIAATGTKFPLRYNSARAAGVRLDEVNVEHITPLIQTLLWVGLIAGLVWRFHVPINGVLLALQRESSVRRMAFNTAILFFSE